jgi:hypothetical protein
MTVTMSRDSISRAAWLLLALGCGGAETNAPASPSLGDDAKTANTPANAVAAGAGGSVTPTPPRVPEPSRPAGAAGSSAKPEPSVAGSAAPVAMPEPVRPEDLEPFSFFVASQRALVQLSGNQNGFGGDLSFGETGAGAGLRGADKICTTIAEMSMPGAAVKQWHAFLSTTSGGDNGGPVHAIERIGDGPWYDRLGRLVSNTAAELVQIRPATADTAIKQDLPNEEGVPNHNPDGTGEVDNHHVLTGSDEDGRLHDADPAATCNDWTKSQADTEDAPRVGLSWPRGGGGRGRPSGSGGGGASGDDAPRPDGTHWISAMDESGCAAGISIEQNGGPDYDNPTVGSGGGYGAIYCFALSP